MTLVVSDTSPIRALHNVRLLHVLTVLFDNIVVPPAVYEELTHPASPQASVTPDEIGFCTVIAPADRTMVRKLRASLDPGEAEAIALAIEINADSLLVDELAARRIAGGLRVNVTGVIAILVRAKNLNLIPAVMPIVLRLRNEFQFRLSSAILDEARRLSGE